VPPTLAFCCGAECGDAAAGAAGGTPHWNVVSGVVEISTTTVRSGLRSWRFNTTAAKKYLRRTVTGAPNRAAFRVAIRFATRPDVYTALVTFRTAGSYAMLAYDAASTKLCVTSQGSGGDKVLATNVATTGVWYVVDFEVTMSADPWVFNWKIDGIAQTGLSPGLVPATITDFIVGVGTEDLSTPTADMFADDIAYSVTGGDYPIGDGRVLSMIGDSDGTHSFVANDFEYDNTTPILSSATDVWTKVSRRPIDALTPFISQNVINSVGYVEVAFEPPPDTQDARGMEVVSNQHASATGANTCTLKLNDGGTLSDVYALADFSNTTASYNSKHYATAPSGGAWTQAKLNALMFRWGYATDVTDIPFLDAVILEVEYPPALVVPTAVVSGTFTAGIAKADIIAGGKVLDITLADTTWIL
jgi:hypothetical protein